MFGLEGDGEWWPPSTVGGGGCRGPAGRAFTSPGGRQDNPHDTWLRSGTGPARAARASSGPVTDWLRPKTASGRRPAGAGGAIRVGPGGPAHIPPPHPASPAPRPPRWAGVPGPATAARPPPAAPATPHPGAAASPPGRRLSAWPGALQQGANTHCEPPPHTPTSRVQAAGTMPRSQTPTPGPPVHRDKWLVPDPPFPRESGMVGFTQGRLPTCPAPKKSLSAGSSPADQW